jgi:hypothetical protein
LTTNKQTDNHHLSSPFPLSLHCAAFTGVNTHFLLGILGFGFLVGTKAFFHSGTGLLGKSIGGIAVSGLMLLLSIINRGVHSGGNNKKESYGSVLGLCGRYFGLLVRSASSKQRRGVLELGGMGVLTVSLALALYSIFTTNDQEDV